MKQILSILYYVFLLGVALIALLLIGTFLPIPGNYSVKTVLSGSMEPTIKTGSIVIIRPEAEYREGDVVTFGKDSPTSTPTTHRIVSEEAVEGAIVYTTKGDANSSPDIDPAPKSTVIGKVLFSIPYLGHILRAVRTTPGFIVVVGIPALVIIYEEGKKIWMEVQGKKVMEKKVAGEKPNDEQTT